MNKKALKTNLIEKQKGFCELSGKTLKKDMFLVDTDRINPRSNGGNYTEENTRIVDPIEHMKRHGNYKTRKEEIDNLKVLIDGREKLLKASNGANNRLDAYKRGTDNLDEQTLKILKEQTEYTKKQENKAERRIKKFVQKMQHHPMIKTAINIRGVGELTIASLIVYVDIEKATNPSKLWAYCGLHKPSHERYEKNVSGGGNKTLRTTLYRMADAMIKTKGAYVDVYYQEKEKLANSKKITSTVKQKKRIECEWRNTNPSHRNSAAKRKMIKHFLRDFWLVWRTLEGLETPHPYVQEKMGHTGIISPKERGWDY